MLVDRGDLEPTARRVRAPRRPRPAGRPGVASRARRRPPRRPRPGRSQRSCATPRSSATPSGRRRSPTWPGRPPTRSSRASAASSGASCWRPVEDDRTAAAADRLRFVEWLVREVAYGTLALRDRRSRHLAAASYYESLDDPEASGAIASHVLAAYRSGPRGTGDPALADRAVAALRTAAERASSLHAPETALPFLEEALGVATDPRQVAAIREQAAAAAQALARLEEAEAYARSALDWYRRARRIAPRWPGRRRASGRSRSPATTRRPSTRCAGWWTSCAAQPGGRRAPDEEAAVVGLLAGPCPGLRRQRAHGRGDRLGRPGPRRRRASAARPADGRRPGGQGCGPPRGAPDDGGRRAPPRGADGGRGARAGGVGAAGPEQPRGRPPRATTRGRPSSWPTPGLRSPAGSGSATPPIRLASNWAEAALEVGEWDAVIDVLAELDDERLPITDRVDLGGDRGARPRLARRPGSGRQVRRPGGPHPAQRRGARGGHPVLPAIARDPRARPAGRRPGGRGGGHSRRERRSAAGRPLARPASSSPGRRCGTGTRTGWRARSRTSGRPGLGGPLDGGDHLDAGGRAGRAAGRDGDRRESSTRRPSAAWRRLDLPLQLALCCLEAALNLPAGSDEAAVARDDARATFERLGARSFLERLAVRARPTPGGGRAGQGPSGAGILLVDRQRDGLLLGRDDGHRVEVDPAERAVVIHDEGRDLPGAVEPRVRERSLLEEHPERVVEEPLRVGRAALEPPGEEPERDLGPGQPQAVQAELEPAASVRSPPPTSARGATPCRPSRTLLSGLRGPEPRWRGRSSVSASGPAGHRVSWP